MSPSRSKKTPPPELPPPEPKPYGTYFGERTDEMIRRPRKRRDFKVLEELPEKETYWPRRNRVIGVGKWGSFLRFAIENPGKWCQSDHVKDKRQVTQRASDIRREYLGTTCGKQAHLLRENLDGHWQAEWGFSEDKDGLIHWVVWVMWDRRAKERNKRNRTKHRRRKEDQPGNPEKVDKSMKLGRSAEIGRPRHEVPSQK